MAIDTAAKRFSIAPMVPGGPRPELSFDGTDNAGDRYSVMGLYDLTDGSAAPEPAPEATPTGGTDTWLSYHRVQAELRRRREREREELEITEAEQRAIDRAAVKIARTMPGVGLDAPQAAQQAVMAAPQFDALLMTLRPSEGEIAALAQAVVDRILWMMAEQEEEEAVVRLLMEMG